LDAKVQAMALAAETEQSLSINTLIKGITLGEVFERYRNEISPSKKKLAL